LRKLVPTEPAWLSQVHGTAVLDAATVSEQPQADASTATQSGIVCVIQTADCLPVLFCDSAGKVVGAAHAGWRGLASGVLDNTVAHMRAAGAGDIVAWLGPAIGPLNFEVGQDVVDAFAQRNITLTSAFTPIAGHAGKYFADIYTLARAILGKLGVTAVHGGGLCTVEDSARFYSYRRDKITGRMASLIWLE
jgi:YfiH family protein